MEKKTVYYVTFWAPGSFVAESWSKDVPTSDPHKVEWPNNAYAFRMFKREDLIDGEKAYYGKPEQIGPEYYHPDSTVETLAEVSVNPKATRVLLDNMRFNGWTHILWTRWGTWPQPFEPGEVQVLKKG